jgi:hypothetical protein
VLVHDFPVLAVQEALGYRRDQHAGERQEGHAGKKGIKIGEQSVLYLFNPSCHLEQVM